MIKISSLFTYGMHIPLENRVKRPKEIWFGILDPSYLFVYLFMIEKEALT